MTAYLDADVSDGEYMTSGHGEVIQSMDNFFRCFEDIFRSPSSSPADKAKANRAFADAYTISGQEASKALGKIREDDLRSAAGLIPLPHWSLHVETPPLRPETLANEDRASMVKKLIDGPSREGQSHSHAGDDVVPQATRHLRA